MERADERVGEESHVDHTKHSQSGGERGSHGTRQLHTERQQRKPVGIIVHNGAGHQTEHGHDGVRNQVPGRQNGSHGSNRIISNVFSHVGIGNREQQTVENQEHIGNGRTECGPEHNAAIGGFARQIARVIGSDVYPAQAKAGHHEEAAAEHGRQ